MTEEKITVENINAPEHIVQVRADKYNEMRGALLQVLPETAPGLPFAAIKEAAKPLLSPTLFPEGKTSGWWAKCVQLDLEAKGEIKRTQGSPLRFYKT